MRKAGDEDEEALSLRSAHGPLSPFSGSANRRRDRGPVTR